MRVKRGEGGGLGLGFGFGLLVGGGNKKGAREIEIYAGFRTLDFFFSFRFFPSFFSFSFRCSLLKISFSENGVGVRRGVSCKGFAYTDAHVT